MAAKEPCPLKVHTTAQIRNVALAGHTSSGKTQLTEAIAWSLKQSPHFGSTDSGNTQSDYDPEEIRRKHSVQTSVIPVEHGDIKVNLLDLPGFRDFIGEIKRGMRAADALMMVFDATGGLETGAESVWQYADEFHEPTAIFINKLDKEHTSFQKSLALLRDQLHARLVPLVLPLGDALEFKGVIDLLRMKVVKEDGQKVTYEDIPADRQAEADAARAELVEAAAEGDDELTMKFLEEGALTDEEVLRGLSEAMDERRFVPVLGGSAAQLKGIRTLIDFIATCMPDPTIKPGYTLEKEGDEPEYFKVQDTGSPVIYVFKTVSDPFAGRLSFFKVLRGTLKGDTALFNVTQNKSERIGHLLACKGKKSEDVAELHAGDIGALAKLEATQTADTLVENGSESIHVRSESLPKPTAFMAVKAKSRADEDKVSIGFHRLIEQDPTLGLYRDPAIKQTILTGMGETHLQIATARLKDLAKVDVDLEIPRVSYRETITKKAEGQGKYKKQTGGHGQYGDCHVRFEPLPEGSGFEFVWEIVGGVIPTNFKGAIEKGLIEALDHGVLAGAPTVDVRAACFYGSYHDVDSSEMSFKIAAGLAFKQVIPKCNPVILEPIYKVWITVPEEYMGDVMGDLNGRRGRILGMENRAGKQMIQAQVPLAEMYTYGRVLNSLTQGRGIFEMEYDHYERVPNEVQEKIIAEAAKRKAEEDAAH
jgi:elongation factor G